jgi:AcrR family transcriptional regulator
MAARTSATKNTSSARDRLLNAADELFYAEGVHTVGIDRVIERAGVAKATLYSAFGSKDDLIVAYLHGRLETRKQRTEAAMAKAGDSPRARILAVFDALGESFVSNNFRGCAFVRARAETQPGTKVADACEDAREWMNRLLLDLARQTGAADPELLARQLRMLYDGATTMAQMERDASAAAVAKATAALLIPAGAGN